MTVRDTMNAPGDRMRDPSSKTVALYARVSTMDQSCAMQLDDLRRYAKQRFGRCYEFVDEGVSGTQRRRPQLDALMKNAGKRRFDVVLVWKFDRFARSVKHLVDSLDEFKALGIDFVSYTEGVDTTTPTGQLLFHIVGAVAQFERDLIAERVRAGIAHARALAWIIHQVSSQKRKDALKGMMNTGFAHPASPFGASIA